MTQYSISKYTKTCQHDTERERVTHHEPKRAMTPFFGTISFLILLAKSGNGNRSASAAWSKSMATLSSEPTVCALERNCVVVNRDRRTTNRLPEAAFLDSPQMLGSGWCFSSRLCLAASQRSMANGATVRGTVARHTLKSTQRNDALRLFMRSIPKNESQVDTIVVGADTVCFANPNGADPFHHRRAVAHLNPGWCIVWLGNQRLSTDQQRIPVFCSPTGHDYSVESLLSR